jgi:hypothetical protein
MRPTRTPLSCKRYPWYAESSLQRHAQSRREGRAGACHGWNRARRPPPAGGGSVT